MTAQFLPARFNIDILGGDDFSIEFHAVDADGQPVDLSAATVEAELVGGEAAFTVGISGAGDNIITVSMSDANTALLSLSYLWLLTVTADGFTRRRVSGVFSVKTAAQSITSQHAGVWRLALEVAG